MPNDSENTQSGSSPSPFTREDVFNVDGKKWSEMYHGLAGRFKQIERQHNQTVSELKGQIAGLEETIADLKGRLEEATGQAAQLDTVKESANNHLTRLREVEQELEQTKLLVSKQRILAKYPQLLLSDSETNPIAKLVESANMSEEELEETLAGLAEQAGSNKVVGMAVPQPGESPKPETTLEKLYEREKEIRQEMNSGNRSLELDREHREVWSKIKELESQVS